MGVIMRQGIKYSIVTYAFMLVSILASILIFPLDTDLYGALTFFVETALLISPVILIGLNPTSIKYFPEVKEKNGSGNLLLNVVLLVLSGSVVLVGVVGLIFKKSLISQFASKSESIELSEHLWVFVPLIFLIALHNFLISHISNYRRIAIPRLVQNLWRISLPLIFILVYKDMIGGSAAVLLILVHFVLVVSLLMVTLHKLDPVRISFGQRIFKFITRSDVRTYAIYAVLTSLGSSMAFKLDTFMVTIIMDTSNTGVYAIGNRIGSIIAVPTLAILAIAGPIISSAMRDNKTEEISNVYRRSSEVLTIAGVIMVSGLFVIHKELFSMMYDSDQLIAQGVFYVVGLIAAARLFDMMTSVNSQIISLSSYFKYTFYFLLGLGSLNILLNLILIPKYGISGAAAATFISLAGYNLIKLIFIWQKLKMWPFTYKTAIILVIALVASAVVTCSDPFATFHPILNLGLRGAMVTVMIITTLYLFKISPDFNHAIDVAKRRARAFLRSILIKE